MLSAMFRRDFASFEAQGLHMTPEDVVRLNALALRVRLSTTAPRSAHLPRLVFMPRDSAWRVPLTLREPTVAHDLWIDQAFRFVDGDDDRNWLFVHAYALSRPASALADPFSPRRVVRAVYRFAAKRLVRFTREQISAAVEYCLFGADWTAGESGGADRRERKAAERYPAIDDPALHSPTIGVLADCRALRVPLSLDDAKRLTASEIAETVLAAKVAAHRFDADAAKADALADYCRARDEIRDRLAKEAAKGGTPEAANGGLAE